MYDGYLAEIRGFAGSFVPKNWMYCEGQQLSVQEYSALFSLLGATYGGDSRTYFNLPDLRGRVPVSAGQAPGYDAYLLGRKGGQERTALSLNQLPVHTHNAATSGGTASISGSATATMKVNNDEAEGKSPSGQYLAVSSSGDIYAGEDTGATLNNGAIAVDTSGLNVNVSGMSIQIANAGASAPVSLMQPYLPIHWIICIVGNYPERSY